MKKVFITTVITLTLLFGSSCAKKGHDLRQKKQEKKEAINVSVEEIELHDLAKFFSISGKLEGISEVSLIAEVSGKITAVNKSLGVWVEKNETIASIDSEQYSLIMQQAEANLLAAKATMEANELSYEATNSLLETEQISITNYKNVLSQYESSQANFKAAQASEKLAKLNYEAANFTAPVSGWITYLDISIGDYVSPGSALIKIVDDRQLILKTGVGEQEITQLEMNQPVNVVTRNLATLNGYITGLGKSPAPGSMNYPIEMTFDNPDNSVLSGSIVTGRILEKSYDNIIYTSVDNVIKSYDKYYIFTIEDGNTAHKVEIQTGDQIGSEIIILSNINVGDFIITDGFESLQDGDQITYFQSK